MLIPRRVLQVFRGDNMGDVFRELNASKSLGAGQRGLDAVVELSRPAFDQTKPVPVLLAAFRDTFLRLDGGSLPPPPEKCLDSLGRVEWEDALFELCAKPPLPRPTMCPPSEYDLWKRVKRCTAGELRGLQQLILQQWCGVVAGAGAADGPDGAAGGPHLNVSARFVVEADVLVTSLQSGALSVQVPGGGFGFRLAVAARNLVNAEDNWPFARRNLRSAVTVEEVWGPAGDSRQRSLLSRPVRAGMMVAGVGAVAVSDSLLRSVGADGAARIGLQRLARALQSDARPVALELVDEEALWAAFEASGGGGGGSSGTGTGDDEAAAAGALTPYAFCARMRCSEHVFGALRRRARAHERERAMESSLRSLRTDQWAAAAPVAAPAGGAAAATAAAAAAAGGSSGTVTGTAGGSGEAGGAGKSKPSSSGEDLALPPAQALLAGLPLLPPCVTVTGFYHVSTSNPIYHSVVQSQLAALSVGPLLNMSGAVVVGMLGKGVGSSGGGGGGGGAGAAEEPTGGGREAETPSYGADLPADLLSEGGEDEDGDARHQLDNVRHHLTASHPKVRVPLRSPDETFFEAATLTMLKAFCDAPGRAPHALVYYFHSKGVTRWHDPLKLRRVEDWRAFMEAALFEQPQGCLWSLLYNGSSTCGVNFSPDPHAHFAGNFWWARCDYVRTLPPPVMRCWTCGEMWINGGQQAPYDGVTNLWSTDTDHYTERYPRSRWPAVERLGLPADMHEGRPEL
jgi:hypothetical protein